MYLTEFEINVFDSNLHIKKLKTIILTFFLVAFILPVQLCAQHKEVVAEKGDGIYRLLTRHGFSVSEHSNAFIELNKNHLGKENTLISGVKYKLPETRKDKPAKSNGKTTRHEIFGEKYADVEITGSELNGAVYYLMGGHGGPDPGAVGKYNNKQLCEDEYAYDVTLRLARNLIQKGATVYMITRDQNDGIRDDSYLRADKDEVCYPKLTIPLNHTRRLRQRTDAVNKLYKKHRESFQRMVAIHVDSRSTGENIDVFFYHG